ncbi:MAG: ABC transporter ATP-binding protein [Candidimonas sp.]|nr:MAG: ABC transporter ATP-binding protein [Candidimonas sp.]TAM22755.1 MAG: ABC transporter ATP-binding protein [Candidimonas sp.]
MVTMNTSSTTLNDTHGDNGAITLEDVAFEYDRGKQPVLQHVNLEVGSGEFFVLLGPSGCGKSTILNLVAGFESASTGKVVVDKRPVTGAGRDRVVIFQDSDSLYGWLSVVDNTAFPLRVEGINRKERRQRAMNALMVVGLHGHENKYPRQLSGGMKQRVQLARALVTNSPVLLMDEPFAALDAQTRSILQDELVQLSSRLRCTILFITHDIGEAILLGDRVGIMRAGPASAIKEIIRVELPRPRQRGSLAFGELYERINQSISEEVRQALSKEDV